MSREKEIAEVAAKLEKLLDQLDEVVAKLVTASGKSGRQAAGDGGRETEAATS